MNRRWRTAREGRLKVGQGFTRLLAIVVLMAAAPAAQQPQAPPRDVGPTAGAATGIIRGVVTAADTGMPLRGAEVRLRGAQPGSRALGAMADGEGRYEVTGLPPGQYTVTAFKPGYVTLAYGQTRVADEGRAVQVRASAVVDRIDVALPRGAVITVRMADEFGDPLPGYRVTAFQPRFVDGRRTLAAVGVNLQYVTDDRGELRLFGLAPGEYYVAASPSGTALVVSPRAKEVQTFYPGTPSESEARPVTVGLGEEIVIAFPLATARASLVRGVVEGITGRPPTLRLARRGPDVTTMVDVNLAPDGTFTAANLVPADYVLTASGESGSGMVRFRVAGEDLDGLVLRLRPPRPLRGRFTFDPKPPADLTPAALQASALRPVVVDDGAMLQPVAQIRNDWTFEIPEALGAGVLRFRQPPRDWFLDAILLDGVEVTDTPLDFSAFEGKTIEVRLTQRTPRVTGTVRDGERRAGTYVAVLFPADPQQWTAYARNIAAARPDQQGQFLIEGVPPGRYLLAAVEHLEPGEERYAGTLERLRNAARPITLGEAETTTVELTLSR